MLTIKSDDIRGRSKTYEAIVNGTKIPEPNIPESFNVLTREIQGLGFNLDVIDQNGKVITPISYTEKLEQQPLIVNKVEVETKVETILENTDENLVKQDNKPLDEEVFDDLMQEMFEDDKNK